MTIEEECKALAAEMNLSPVDSLMIYHAAGAPFPTYWHSGWTVEQELAALKSEKQRRESPAPGAMAPNVSPAAEGDASRPVTVKELAELNATLAANPKIEARMRAHGLTKAELIMSCRKAGVDMSAASCEYVFNFRDGWKQRVEANRPANLAAGGAQPQSAGARLYAQYQALSGGPKTAFFRANEKALMAYAKSTKGN